MELVEPTNNEYYTTTEIVYEITLATTLYQIVNDEVFDEEDGEEGTEEFPSELD